MSVRLLAISAELRGSRLANAAMGILTLEKFRNYSRAELLIINANSKGR
jgi:hypothetical protein